MSRIQARFDELGLTLPPPPPLGGEYVRTLVVGNLLFTSGHGPYRDGGYAFKGSVSSEISVDEAREAARLTILNILASVKAELGTLDRVDHVVKMLGMVNSDPTFIEQPRVIDAASDLLVEIFEERGRHTRSAVGMASLEPSNVCQRSRPSARARRRVAGSACRAMRATASS
jgi:enamine deaminase RidA (YjgF/YER057c/UK114 family)